MPQGKDAVWFWIIMAVVSIFVLLIVQDGALTPSSTDDAHDSRPPIKLTTSDLIEGGIIVCTPSLAVPSGCHVPPPKWCNGIFGDTVSLGKYTSACTELVGNRVITTYRDGNGVVTGHINVGLCADGSFSPNAGSQGGCSWHGGWD